MRIAHLTDLHLPIPVRPSSSDLLNKRILGYLSWRRTRRHRHRIAALEAIVADCRREAPDFTAISGDLLNISLAAEFSVGAQWLKDNFEGDSTAFAPGNHDSYVAVDWANGLGMFSDYMLGERAADGIFRAPAGPEDFPFVRTVGDAGFIFANSAPPTAPGLATGRLGPGQISRIEVELDRLRAAGKCRILVLHHPVTKGVAPRRKALDDQDALRKAIFDKGVDLILHGHTHRPVWTTIETRDGQRPVIGGASASHPCAHGAYRPARYNLISIVRACNATWRIDVDIREFDPANASVRTVETRALSPAGS
ncbi:MAG: metallophosphoesterase [Parvularculaceae bacterium]|nr:metallophosphoesterase [Parvularculaceae bacterium]